MTGPVAVVGGGIIGLSVAWKLHRRGVPVTVFDPAPGSGASGVAAGMLAPAGEAYFGEDQLIPMLVESARRWPGFADELERAAGMDAGYRRTGTLATARTADDLAELDRLVAFQRAAGLPVTRLRPADLRAAEPSLSPRLRGGAAFPEDHQVDPRRAVAALLAALAAAGVPVRREAVRDLSDVEQPVVVVAAGCGSAALAGVAVRPVKGQVLRLRPVDPALPRPRRVVRGYVDGRTVYLVPREDGEVVVGATSEERSDLDVTAQAVRDLLDRALAVVPGLAGYVLAEARAGLRPGTPDNAPVIGELRPGVLAATGHYRHGVLLAPLTADLICERLGV